MPISSSVHVDSLLTNLSIAWMNDDSSFIANRVFPTVSVSKQSDKYRIYNKNDWFRNEARRRADTTASNSIEWTLSDDAYYADVYAIKTMIGDQTAANFDQPGDLLQDSTRLLIHKIMLQREIQFATDYLKTGVWGLDKVGVSTGETGTQFRQWNDYANSDPVVDVENGKTAVAAETGMEANTLVLGRDVLATLRNHPDIIDRINYTGNGGRTGADESVLAGVFGVDRVLIARAIKATNAEGATAAYSKVGLAKAAFLAYSAPNPGLMQPSAGYTFAWNNIPGGQPGSPVAVKRWRDEELAAEVVEAQTAYANKVIAPELGVFFSAAIA